jgi:hypothetical protein
MGTPTRLAQTLLPGSISIVCDEHGGLICKRCLDPVKLGDIAFLTRTAPADDFEAWCAECSLILSRWALTGAIDHGWAVPEDVLPML